MSYRKHTDDTLLPVMPQCRLYSWCPSLSLDFIAILAFAPISHLYEEPPKFVVRSAVELLLLIRLLLSDTKSFFG
jgi:hypothetical protein